MRAIRIAFSNATLVVAAAFCLCSCGQAPHNPQASPSAAATPPPTPAGNIDAKRLAGPIANLISGSRVGETPGSLTILP